VTEEILGIMQAGEPVSSFSVTVSDTQIILVWQYRRPSELTVNCEHVMHLE